MSLADIIANWNNTFANRIKSNDDIMRLNADRPYLQELARANRDKEVANAGLKGIELQFAPRMTEADLELKRLMPSLTRSQIGNLNEQLLKSKFGRENPLMDKSGTAGQIGALMYLNNHPEISNSLSVDNIQPTELPGNVGMKNEKISPWKREDLEISPSGIGRLKNLSNSNIGSKNNDIASLLKESLVTDLKRKNAYAELADKKSENYGYGQLTADQKRAWVATAKGMGVGENDARDFFNKGYDIKDLAEAKGFDPNDLPEAIYNPTQTDITRAHFRQQAVAEIDAIQPILTEALAPYSQRVSGFSPKQISEALKGENPDGQARFLAAKGLMPELNALRVKALGGQVGMGTLDEVKHASMAELNAFQGLVTPEVYMKAQQYMQEWINSASKTASELAFNPEKAQNKEIGAKKTNSVQEDPLGIR